MTHLLHKIVLLLSLLGCTSAIFAATANEAEYKKLSKSWTLNVDGSQEFHYNMELTVYTHTATHSAYGESFVTYNPTYQTLKINTSYTKQKDGTIVKTPDNAFVEVLPSAAVNAPYYNNWKEMVIVHTGLELGATIYLDYTLTSKAGYLPALDIAEPLEQTSPVKEYTISVSVPQGKELHYSVINSNAQAKTNISNGQSQTTWTLKNTPASSRARYQRSDAPLLTATTYASQAEALKSIYAQMETKQSNMPLLSLAETVTTGKSNDAEKAQAIVSFIHKEFGHSALSLEETGYRIRPVEDVINSAYGTDAELVNLTQGLLNALKIKAEPCALYPVQNPDNKMGLKPIHLFVKADVNGQTWLIDPKKESMDQAGWMASRNYIADLKGGNALSLPTIAADLTYEATLKLTEGKAEANVKAEVPSAMIDYTDCKAAAYTAGDEKATVKRTADKTHIEFTTEAKVAETNGITTVTLPDSPAGMAHTPYVKGNTTRDCNLVLPYAANESYTYTVQIPAGKSCITPNTTKNVSNAAGSVQITIEQNGDRVTVKRSLKMKSATISKSDYTAFHTLLATWVNPNYNVLMFNNK